MTAVGAPIDPVDDEVDAAFESAAEGAARAEHRHGTEVDEVRLIGGLRVRLRITGQDLAAALMPALAHHPRAEPADGHDIEMRAWDAASADGRLPQFPHAALDGGTSGAARIEAERRGPHPRLRYQPDERALSLYDPDRRVAWFCVADPQDLPYWERGAPMRALFHWIMEDRGRALVHAAAVGRSDGGLLIVGRGGSGKSTTALSCVGRGLRYLADDYCIVEPAEPDPLAHSLYSSAKLHHHQVSRLPHLAPWVTNASGGDSRDDTGEEKALLFVADHVGHEQLIETFPIRAVVVPTITGRPTTTVVSTSAGAALGALAPSSVLQAPGGGAGTLALLARLVRSLPSIELRLGTDVDALAGHLARLLDDLAPDPHPVSAPLVSVVIPLFAGSAFIGDALASIAAQDHPAIEVVLVDDGSTDDGAAVARARADQLGLSLTVVREANQGPAVARNLALEHTRGIYITFLDADDAMVADRLSFGVAHLAVHPDADGVVGTHLNVVDEGVNPPEWLAKLPDPDDNPHYLVMTLLARAEVFDRVGGFDPSYAFAGEDTEWYLRAKSAGARIDLVDHLMLRRRIHGANLTYQVEDLDRALFRLLRERTRRARSNPTRRP